MLDRISRRTPRWIKDRVPRSVRARLEARLARGAAGSETHGAPLWPTSDDWEELPIQPDSPNTGLCELAGPAKYSDPRWRELHEDLETYSYDKHAFSPNIYRKGWEWTQAIYGLERLDMLDANYSALGVGAGRECVIFWLGARLRQVVATDLYGNERWTSAGGKEADPGILDDPQKYCARPMHMDRIRFMTMDGTRLEFEDETFDIAWSLSSIEHFGGHERSAQAVREMARVIRQGGVVVVATEYLLLEEYAHPEFFNKRELYEYVVHASPQLELVEPINFTLPSAEYLVDSVVVPQGVEKTRRHIVLNDGRVQWTSVMIFLRRR